MTHHQGFRPIIHSVNPPNLIASASILAGMTGLLLIV